MEKNKKKMAIDEIAGVDGCFRDISEEAGKMAVDK
jgi:hypothetical protein